MDRAFRWPNFHPWLRRNRLGRAEFRCRSCAENLCDRPMSFIGWKVWGFPGAVAAAGATFGPPCVIYYGAYRPRHRSRHAGWHPILRRGLVPVVTGLIIAGGIVMARAADADWQAATVTVAVAVLMLQTRINPIWLLCAG